MAPFVKRRHMGNSQVSCAGQRLAGKCLIEFPDINIPDINISDINITDFQTLASQEVS